MSGYICLKKKNYIMLQYHILLSEYASYSYTEK